MWRINDQDVSTLYDTFSVGRRGRHRQQQQQQHDRDGGVSKLAFANLDEISSGFNDGWMRRGKKRNRSETTSVAFRPRPQLNGQLHEYKPRVEMDGMETSSLGLTFTVQQEHIAGITLECRSR